MNEYDIGIIGGGPGGSTLASLLCKKGFKVVLFEKENFPRFRIGESLLPCSMDIFREIGIFDFLNSGKYIQKFGARFIDHRTGECILFNFWNNIPSQSMAFEVPREEFDADLLQHAKSLGTTIRQPECVNDIIENPDDILVKTDKDEYRVKYLADASGRIAFIGNKKKMRQPNPDLINNIGIFAHYKGVQRDSGERAGDIIISILPNKAWSWIIPFQGERTSVGVVTSTKFLSSEVGFENYLNQSIQGTPLFASFMEKAERITEVRSISNYSHTCEAMVGPRWVQIGDAGAFLDPIFSSGVHVSITSAKFASEMIQSVFDKNQLLNTKGIGDIYETNMRKGIARFHYLIRLFYDTDFVKDMKKLLTLKHSREAFTSAVAGGVWNDDNVLFKMQSL